MKSYNQRRSRLQEKRTAEDLEGRVHRGSGSSDFAKSDVRRQGELSVECKFTKAKSYSLKVSDIMKIRREAQDRGEDWAMQIEFVGGMSQKVAIIDWNTYVGLRRLQIGVDRISDAIEKNPQVSVHPALEGLRDHMMTEEARASVALDNGEVGTFTVPEEEDGT